jgi:hypothetical protein
MTDMHPEQPGPVYTPPESGGPRVGDALAALTAAGRGVIDALATVTAAMTGCRLTLPPTDTDTDTTDEGTDPR